MHAGAEGTVRARLPGGTVDLVRVVGVATDQVVSMEVVAPLKTAPLDEALRLEDPTLEPATYIDEAWALYRDRDGNLVWGVPTEWRTVGTRPLVPAPNAPNPSRVLLLDECEPIRPRRHRFKAQARSAIEGIDLQDASTFRYRYPERTLEVMGVIDNDEALEPHEACAARRSGCDTVSTAPAWALMWGGLNVWGRRRRTARR